jgi:nitrogen regulatory protein P-II 1
MKLVVAIIRPEKLQAVQEELAKCDINLMTVTEVRGCGRQRGYTESYRGVVIKVRLIPKIKLEIALNNAFVDVAIKAIKRTALSEPNGRIGDGKIFVLPLEECVRIRTSERGMAAIGP